MALPNINIPIINTLYKASSDGSLIYKYQPFNNLKKDGEETDLAPLSIDSKKAEISIDKPINVEIEEAYDGSVNLIVNDGKHPLKMVNSRFSLTDSSNYKIADRKGNLDTNIYTEDNFKIESGLIKTVRSIISVDFLGIENGGMMPVGNYTFYFKLADADGNESDFIAESGKVVCHIGDVNQPKSIRGGQQHENSYKLIKFRLNNLDLAYDYINIYYTRTTGDDVNQVVSTHKINDKFRINKLNTDITITGYEKHEEISLEDINIRLENFDSVKTNVNCQNISFNGNITNDYSLFEILEKLSLFVVPEISTEEDIGHLSHDYTELYPNTGFEYFNTSNIYYRLGYWDEEIYRFGIVYILNDYSLSPVFNIRGISELSPNTKFSCEDKSIDDEINYGEDNIIEESNGIENSKGVIKINNASYNTFNGEGTIKPIGLKFKFTADVLDGKANPGLKSLTKGFFIVRQKRIPTILAQAIGIGTSAKSFTPTLQVNTSKLVNKWLGESFLTPVSGNPMLGRSIFPISAINTNALLCPEASLRRPMYNNYFNSSEYLLRSWKYNVQTKIFYDYTGNQKQFSLDNLKADITLKSSLKTSLTLVEPGIDLIKSGESNTNKFASKAGDKQFAYKCLDPVLGDYEDPLVLDPSTASDWYKSSKKIRGEFNTFIGCNSNGIQNGVYYNIYTKDYDESKWKDYFKLRYNDSNPFMPISNRIGWSGLISNKSKACYRGDCYINTFTQRMTWNFVDPDLPTNKKIVDRYTWYKNYRVLKKASTVVDGQGVPNSALEYRKLLPLFTYKQYSIPSFSGDSDDDIEGIKAIANGIIEPDAKKYKKYSEANGVFGSEKINRPDVNAVGLGYWVTVKICSNINLSMRDLDFAYPEEEAKFKKKRGFYPLQTMDQDTPLPESSVINAGISKSLGDKYYFEIPDVPFIQNTFSTRIYYSDVLQKSAFTNGNRVFRSQNFTDYTMEYGAIVKLVEWYGTLVAVMEHGVLLIPVNERAMMTNANGENVYINTTTTLPANPKVLSNTFGSLWADSIIKTPRFIYGIDTVGKKIWRTNGQQFEIISDLKVQKFLNDNITLRESDTINNVGVSYVKSHYNAFKQDIMFVFKYGETKWNLCWNEVLSKWVTQYTWFPEFSENINNIFYTFADQSIHSEASNFLYKHGFAGTEEVTGLISPTLWYETQYPFEYEFVVADMPGVQKIFNNLKIVSNLAEPDSLFYEIVGEGFEWNKLKDKFFRFKTQIQFSELLKGDPTIKKVPYIMSKSFNVLDSESFFNQSEETIRDISIREHNKTKEKLVNVFQKAMDIKKYSRMRGNMQYLEDSWDIQIQPLTFKYAYLTSGGQLGIINDSTESRIRDKYIKIRVKYSGKQYAIINALKTLYTISYA